MRSWLVDARKAKGYSQQRLADIIGIKRQTISQIEQGGTFPNPHIAKSLSLLLDFDIAAFYADITEPAHRTSA